jgi:cytochrome c5
MTDHQAHDQHHTDHHDKAFFDTFMLVLGALGLITLSILFLARAIHAQTAAAYLQESEFAQAAVLDRITPVGEVRHAGDAEVTMGGGDVIGVGDEVLESLSPAVPMSTEEMAGAAPAPVSEPTAAPVATAAIDGAQVYNSGCVACHSSGIAGAPRVGDASAWAARIEQGMDTLYEHAIDGYTGSSGFMPAKGGNGSLSDEEVRAAVDHMVEQSQ